MRARLTHAHAFRNCCSQTSKSDSDPHELTPQLRFRSAGVSPALLTSSPPRARNPQRDELQERFVGRPFRGDISGNDTQGASAPEVLSNRINNIASRRPRQATAFYPAKRRAPLPKKSPHRARQTCMRYPHRRVIEPSGARFGANFPERSASNKRTLRRLARARPGRKETS